ncbi:Flp pilus assembly protein TadG [Catenulispora sp. GAS73]
MVIIAPFLLLVMTFVVLLGRLSMADIDVNTAAHAASRAASLATDSARARAVSEQTAATIPSSTACTRRDVKVDTASFKPGGVVRVTISCHISLQAITGLLPGTQTLTASSVSPVDPFRSTP